jgi:hypothetical protein
MKPQPDEREAFEGIRFDFPFLSFRIGRGNWGTTVLEHDDAYEQARRRVRARLGFYRHLATYAAVIAAFVFVDLITGGGLSSLVLWVAAIWGALLVWHWFNVFVFPSIWSPETEERMIEEELRRQQGG